MIRGIFIGILFIVGISIFVFCINAISFGNYAFWAPKIQDVQTNVFRHSQAYTEGYQRDVDNLKLEITDAKTQEKKEILEDVLRHRLEGYNTK